MLKKIQNFYIFLITKGLWFITLSIVLSVIYLYSGGEARGAPLKSLTGPVEVIDGDTIRIKGSKIRLFGIDAPERRQSCTLPKYSHWACGSDAADYLKAMAQGKVFKCDIINVDQYKRYVAECWTQDNLNVNAKLVAEGWALNYDKYTLKYKAVQKLAEANKKGIWISDFVAPWLYRKFERSNEG